MRRLGLLLVVLAILIEYCVAHNSGECANATFKIDRVFTEELKDPNSFEYWSLVEHVNLELISKIPKFRNRNIYVNSFSKGPNGKVIVHITVATDKKNQNTADNFLRNQLEQARFKDVSVGVSLCVAGYQESSACRDMKGGYPDLNIICVEARDRYECIQWLDANKVDVVRGDAEDIYLANEMFGANLSVVAETRDKKKKYDTCQNRIVAVVRRSTIIDIQSLKGSKFCSTGYDTTSGWFVPLSKLLDMDEMTCSGTGSVLNQNLGVFSSYFSEACLPGQWGPIKAKSNNFKKNEYSNLCSLCKNSKKCMKPAGQKGALRCLNSGGDVAWANLEAVKKFPFANTDFGFLCLDGSIEDLSTKNPCIWAGKPWPGWLIRADEKEPDVIVLALTKAANAAQKPKPIKGWAKAVLGITKRSFIIELDPPLSPEVYLNQCGYYNILSQPGCPGGGGSSGGGNGRKRRLTGTSEDYNVKFCVTSDIALDQCKAFAIVLNNRYSLRPLLTCVKEDDCITAVKNGFADFVPLDGGDVFTANRNHELIPVVSEVYDEYAASYFAVAVVKKGSGITKLSDLKGKNSCHTGIDKTAGWNMPLETLLELGILNKDKCDYPGQIGGFFKESCAPGANYTKYDPNDTNPSSLCDLCIGNGKHEFVCDRNEHELYYGYDGAFRCLVQGGGDVAFVKQTTVRTNTEPVCKKDTWCENVISSDYLLLCKDNTTKNVSDYKDCNLGENPSHMVVTRNTTADDIAKREDIRNLLLDAAQSLLLDAAKGNVVFALFGDHDVLFKTSATNLIDLSKDGFYNLTKETYWQALETLENCG